MGPGQGSWVRTAIRRPISAAAPSLPGRETLYRVRWGAGRPSMASYIAFIVWRDFGSLRGFPACPGYPAIPPLTRALPLDRAPKLWAFYRMNFHVLHNHGDGVPVAMTLIFARKYPEEVTHEEFHNHRGDGFMRSYGACLGATGKAGQQSRQARETKQEGK